MLLDSQAAPLLGLDDSTDRLGEFRVTDQQEIAGFLRVVMDRSLPVRLSGPRSPAITARLLAVDTATATLTWAPEADPLVLDGLLRAGSSHALAFDDSVKYQFALAGLKLVQRGESTALQCNSPLEIYRFQRRNFFRAKAGERGAPTMKLRHPSDAGLTSTLRVLDVSVGGCGLLVPKDAPEISEGTSITGARLELDPDSRHLLNFVVRSASEMLDSNGEPAGTRLGCEWTDLPGQTERALQSYVDHLQKRRRMLSKR